MLSHIAVIETARRINATLDILHAYPASPDNFQMRLLSREVDIPGPDNYLRTGDGIGTGAISAIRAGRRLGDDLLSDLLMQIANRDERAFKHLYDLTARRLLAVVSNILRHGSEAEDALQETFLRIWRYARHYAVERGAPMAWMHIIARNAALDLTRIRRDDLDENALDTLEFSTPPQEPPDMKLAKSLRKLPPEQANAIVIMYTYGFSHEELARVLKIPLGTAKSWIKRGTEQLREDIIC